MKVQRAIFLFGIVTSALVWQVPGCHGEEFDGTDMTVEEEQGETQPRSLEDRVNDLEKKYVAIAEKLNLNTEAEPSAETEDPPQQHYDAAAISRGRQLFSQNCAKCHGATGAGNGPFARAVKNIQDLRAPSMANKSDQELFDTISSGKGMMPSYGNSLSEKDRWNLVKYVRTLAPGSAQ